MKLVRKFDQTLFESIDKAMEKSEVKKYADLFASLEEKQQTFIRIGLTSAVIIVPLLFILIFTSIKGSIEKEISLKKDILTLSKRVLSMNMSTLKEERVVLGNTQVSTEGQFSQKIINTLALVGINSQNLQTSNYQMNDLDGNIIESSVDVKFNSLTNDQLFGLISRLVSKEKIKVYEISVKKNEQSQALDGIMTLLYYNKDIIE